MTTLDQNEDQRTEPALPAANSGLKVGWVGLGDQGAPMARAIAAAGFEREDKNPELALSAQKTQVSCKTSLRHANRPNPQKSHRTQGAITIEQ